MLDISDRGTLGLILAAVGVLWLVWTAMKLSNPVKHSFLYLDKSHIDMAKLEALEHDAIAEWYVNETENLVVVKYKKDEIEEDEIKAKIIS